MTGPMLPPLLLALGVQTATEPVPDPVPPAAQKQQRLEQDRTRLRASLERARETDLSARLLTGVESLLASDPSPGWLQLEGWALRRKDLESYLEWFRPDPERGGLCAALDVDGPRHPLQRIRHYAETLAEHGIDLLVVPIPMRIQVYPDRIPGVRLEEPFHGVGGDYTRLLLAISEAGVEVVDLLPSFAHARDDGGERTDQRVFMDYDHHWTPRGVALAAEVIADRVRSFPWYRPGPDRAGVDFQIALTSGAPGPAQETHREEVWFRSVQPIGEESGERGGEPAGEGAEMTHGSILLIGDSFVGAHSDRHSDLAGHLYARLGHRVDMIYNSGGGMRVWKTVARRGDRLLQKKLIIWAFYSRALGDPPTPRVKLFDR